MGIIASRHLSAEKLEQIQNESGFSPLRIDYLLGQYQSLERDADGRVLRSELLKVPPVATHPLAERLVDVYLHPSLGFQHFMDGLARFRRSVPLQHKLQSLLDMYDSDGDGLLSPDQCAELIGRLPATPRQLHAMRWKLNQLLTDQARDSDRDRDRDRDRDWDRDRLDSINCDDLGYITREVDLNQSLSLRFD